jgi:drug/metabolite transporter (DMT)-like permease
VKTRYFVQLIALSALWGASFLFLRVASPVLGPNVLAVGRIGLATVTLALIMAALKQRWPWRHWVELTRLGALSVAVPFLLYAWAALRLPAGYSALLNSTVVVFGTLAAAWMKEDTLTARKLAGCVVGFAGVGLIVRLGPVAPTPEVLLATLACIAAAACYGVSTPLMKRATKHMEPLAIAAGIHLASLVVLLPGAFWTLAAGALHRRRDGRAAGAGCGDLGAGLLAARAGDPPCVAGGRHEPGLHDPGVRRDLGPPVPGRAAGLGHLERRRADPAGDCAGDRLQPGAETAGCCKRQTLTAQPVAIRLVAIEDQNTLARPKAELSTPPPSPPITPGKP